MIKTLFNVLIISQLIDIAVLWLQRNLVFSLKIRPVNVSNGNQMQWSMLKSHYGDVSYTDTEAKWATHSWINYTSIWLGLSSAKQTVKCAQCTALHINDRVPELSLWKGVRQVVQRGNVLFGCSSRR